MVIFPLLFISCHHRIILNFGNLILLQDLAAGFSSAQCEVRNGSVRGTVYHESTTKKGIW